MYNLMIVIFHFQAANKID